MMQSESSDRSPEQGMLDAMANAQVAPAPYERLVADGTLHRYDVEGDRKGSKNGWYVLYRDGVPAGAFGSWRAGVQAEWCDVARKDLTPEQRAENKARMERARAQRKDEERLRHTEAARRASEMWPKLAECPPSHPYLARKGVKPHGTRTDGTAVMVPMYGPDGAIRGLQRIEPDGSKRFSAGAEAQGAFFVIGALAGARAVVVCEGFATGATLHEAAGAPVVCAFNAGNLEPVAVAMRRAAPKAEIVIAADNDWRTLKPVSNPGVAYATKAANACHGRVAVPPQMDDGTDFNDLAAKQGLPAVRDILFAPKADDKAELHYTNTGGLRQNLHNAVEIVRRDYGTRLRLEEFSGLTMFDSHPITDDDALTITKSVQQQWFCDIPEKLVARAIRFVATTNPFNASHDWLLAHEWDGVERAAHFLSDHCEAESGEYAAFVGRHMVCTLAARILSPGIKSDMMAVMVGGQGGGKSTMLSILGGPFYHAVGDPIGSKDFLASIQPYALVEIEELASFRKAENDMLKKRLSDRVDEFRRPYGTLHERRPRHCIFVGTTNRETFLTDDTGNRRFLPLQVGAIDLDSIRSIAAQLIAEGVALYRSGWAYWQPPIDKAAAEQERRFDIDEWLVDRVSAYLEKMSGQAQFLARDVIDGCEIPPQMGSSAYKKLPKVMQRLGFVKMKSDGQRVYRKL